MKYVYKSSNRKISSGKTQVDCTYAPIKQTCPDTCKLKNNGCYAALSFVGIINKKLENSSQDLSKIDCARAEAKAIDNSYDKKVVPPVFLRLHVSGESQTIKGSKLINSAVKRWKKRGGKQAWSYTHCWKKVPRETWSNVSMLASIDDYKDIPLAIERGYVPAIVVGEFPKLKKFEIKDSPIEFLPCPAQIKEDVSCDTCKLCLNDGLLKKLNVGIAFAAHSVQANKIKKRLNVIQ